jgi:hypothetical protein
MPGLIVAAAITTIKNITEVTSASLLMRILLLIRWARTATLFSGKLTTDRDVCSSVAVLGADRTILLAGNPSGSGPNCDALFKDRDGLASGHARNRTSNTLGYATSVCG